MGIFGNRNSNGRIERAEMEEASRGARSGDFEEKLHLQTGDEKFAHTYRNRGRLYDKIHVSLHTMDIIIYVVVALIVIALIVGIAIGN
ncbi:MAG: hypothetical protein SO121_05410 [Eggerthellaceae bacterium]|nr:hypothetical protein [Eggerthellaceae bacterium]